MRSRSHRALEDGPSELVEARKADSWHVGSDLLARPAGDALDHADLLSMRALLGVVSYSVVAREAEVRCENRWPLSREALSVKRICLRR